MAPIGGARGLGGPHGLLGAYALHLLASRPIYGWELAECIATTTQGGWRPSAGAVYPVLRTLVARGLARTESREGRKLYVITASGRSSIAGFRERLADRTKRFGQMRLLLFEMLPPEQRADWMLGHLRGALAVYLDACSRPEAFSPATRRRLREEGRREIERALREPHGPSDRRPRELPW